jgi:hypothetical protein
MYMFIIWMYKLELKDILQVGKPTFFKQFICNFAYRMDFDVNLLQIQVNGNKAYKNILSQRRFT